MPTLYTRITTFNKGRLPDMLKLKYKAMSLNVFSFFRGTCHLFYQDLAAAKPLPVSPPAWICGDLHLENFGSFKGDDQQEYFDLNDFDEAMLAPACWEVVRMVTSLLVACESMGIKKEEALKIARIFLDTYKAVLKHGKALSIDARTAEGMVHTLLNTVKKRKQKELLKKLAISKKGSFSALVVDARHFKLAAALKTELIGFLTNFISADGILAGDFKVLDCVFRLAGTGSVGVKRYLFLLKNQDKKGKYLLLDMKQALPSSLKPYVKNKQPKWDNDACRVITVQEHMQNVSPALLNTVIFKNDPYVLKQMQPIADRINFETIKDECLEVDKVVAEMAMLTASAQLRSSGRKGSAIADDLVAFGENKEWSEPILNYAVDYAGQVTKDYDEFMADFRSGKY